MDYQQRLAASFWGKGRKTVKLRENFRNAFDKAKEETAELKEEIRAQRFKEKIQPVAMDAYRQFDGLRGDLKRRAGNLSKIIDGAMKISQPESETAQLIKLLQQQEIRRGLEGLSSEEQRKICQKKSDAGDRAFFDAIQEAPFELVPEHVRAGMEKAFVKQAAASDRNVQIALDGMPELQREADVLDHEIRQAEKEIRSLLTDEGIGSLNEIPEMSTAEKSDYIAKHGVESFKGLFDSGIR